MLYFCGGGGKTYLTSKTLSLTTLAKDIALAFLLLFFTVPSFAQGEFTVDNIIYELTDGNSVRVKSNNLTTNTALTIPSTVTSNETTYNVVEIGDQAFYNCANLTSITLPNSITSIGIRAFNGCTNLTSVTIPGVTSIGGNAFQGCTNLTSVTIPGVTSIGGNAFNGCTELTSITIPGGVTTISGRAFKGCTKLSSVTIQEGVTTIKANAFDGCTALTSITLPNTITTIQQYAFSNSGLTSITIPSGVTTIDEYTFSNCAALSTITLPNTITTIKQYAFNNCAALSSIVLPNNLTTIGNHAFDGCTNLNTITIPDGVTSINNYAFSNCTSLETITLPNNLTTIGLYAFSNCTSLETITLPNNLTTINEYAFENCTALSTITLPKNVSSGDRRPYIGCTNLQAIYVADGNNSLSSEDGVLYSYDKTKLCVYPAGKTGESFTIPSSVTFIGNRAFQECKNLTSITVPNSVTNIGNGAFWDCSGLTSITLPNTVTYMGINVFRSCTNLTSITLPTAIPSIGQQTFLSCKKLESVTIPGSVASIGAKAFSSCLLLTSVTMEGETPPTLDNIDAFPYSNTGFTVYVPCGSKTAYTSATNWSNSSISSTITANLAAEIAEDKYLADCDCTFPSTITIKDGASLSAGDYSALATKLSGKTVNVEKELAIEKWNMIGNLSNTNTYSMLLSNAGNSTNEVHAFAVRQFDYTNNNYGSYLHYTDNTPEDYGSFFAWPFKNLYETGVETNEDATVTLTQEITSVNTSSVAFSATNNNSDKWFALSNPYIGRLNLNAFYTANTFSIQGTKAYVWDISLRDANMSSVTGDWKEVEISSGAPALYPATGFLIAGQNASTTFNFTTSQILTGSATATYKAEEIDKEIVFTVLSNGIEKKAYAQLDEQADNGFDGRDSYILFSSNEDAVNPYFAVEGKNLLDNRFNTLPYTTDLNFNAYKSNVVEFVLSKTDEELELTLIDLADENSETVLNVNDPVTINVTAGQNEGRYQIRFARKNSSISEVANEVNNISIWNSQSVVTINGKNLKRVEIYNTLGQRVYSSSLSGESTTFDSKLNNGAYIIKVYTANSSKSEKIIIR